MKTVQKVFALSAVIFAIASAPRLVSAFVIDTSNTYSHTGTVSVGTTHGVSVTAYCNAGDLALSGGCFSNGALDVVTQAGQYGASPQGWVCTWDNGYGSPGTPPGGTRTTVVACAHP